MDLKLVNTKEDWALNWASFQKFHALMLQISCSDKSARIDFFIRYLWLVTKSVKHFFNLECLMITLLEKLKSYPNKLPMLTIEVFAKESLEAEETSPHLNQFEN